MNKDYVRIYLAENETGWAKPIRDNLVRIASVPYSRQVGFEDIVELDHSPGEAGSLPKITKIVQKSGLVTTIVQYEKAAQGYQLMNLFALLEGLSEGIFQPEEGKPGLLAVAHPETIDPVGVAKAIGIPQPLAETSLVEKLQARWPKGTHGSPGGRLSPVPRSDEDHEPPQPEENLIRGEPSDKPHDVHEPVKDEVQDLSAALQEEIRKAGIRVEVSARGEWLSFDTAEDLLAFVAVVTRGGPDDLYWDVMDYHPDHDFFESSWSYFIRPSEHEFEFLDTNRGKRWCRALKLDFDLSIPAKQVPVILGLFESHNAVTENGNETPTSLHA